MSDSGDIIDLTNSFTLVDHCGLTNVIIDLDTDDSLCIETECSADSTPVYSGNDSAKSVKSTLRQNAARIISNKKLKQHLPIRSRPRKSDTQSPICEKKKKFGGCPICWDEIGKNPLASTKCGHVYCIKCIQEYLKVEKKCPTCRESLKGSAAYHPIYLSRE